MFLQLTVETNANYISELNCDLKWSSMIIRHHPTCNISLFDVVPLLVLDLDVAPVLDLCLCLTTCVLDSTEVFDAYGFPKKIEKHPKKKQESWATSTGRGFGTLASSLVSSPLISSALIPSVSRHGSKMGCGGMLKIQVLDCLPKSGISSKAGWQA